MRSVISTLGRWSPKPRRVLAAGVLSLLALGAAPGAMAQEFKAGPWKSLFDGKTLNGWSPKIAKHPFGDNYRQTFIVKDGAIQVSYAGYDKLDNQFGHLFYKAPFKAYRLRFTYQFLTEGGLADTPAWARSNSGVMFHSQPPETMSVDQPFPISVEFQLLGRDSDAPRPTGAVCTPGMNITIDGVMAKAHCTPPVNAPTIDNGTWTEVELEVRPNGEVFQKINGAVVHHYAGLALDPADGLAKPYIAAHGDKPVTGGYIALQSEGHPIAFKDIKIQELR